MSENSLPFITHNDKNDVFVFTPHTNAKIMRNVFVKLKVTIYYSNHMFGVPENAISKTGVRRMYNLISILL